MATPPNSSKFLPGLVRGRHVGDGRFEGRQGRHSVTLNQATSQFKPSRAIAGLALEHLPENVCRIGQATLEGDGTAELKADLQRPWVVLHRPAESLLGGGRVPLLELEPPFDEQIDLRILLLDAARERVGFRNGPADSICDTSLIRLRFPTRRSGNSAASGSSGQGVSAGREAAAVRRRSASSRFPCRAATCAANCRPARRVEG